MYELILLIYVAVVFVAYNTYITAKYGILQSISASFYETHKPGLFALFIWSIALPLNFIASSPLMFWGAAFLCFVGASPAFEEKMEGWVHRIGANGGIAFVCLALWVDHGSWWPAALVGTVGALGYIFQPKNWFWWVEMVAFVSIITQLFILTVF